MDQNSANLAEQLSTAEGRAAIVGRLIDRLAHRIRNPLSAIATSAYCLHDGHPELDEQARTHLRRISEQVTAVERLLHHVVEFADRTTCGRQQFAVQTVVGDALAATHLAAKPTRWASLPERPIEVVADPDQVRRAITLLLEFMARMSRDPAALRLSLAEKDEHAEILLHAEQTGLTAPQAQSLLKSGPALPDGIEDPYLAMAAIYAAANGATLEILSAHDGEITVCLRLRR
jgi:light-regulated signal transduction histidine kinase (bacteriophytochrome)